MENEENMEEENNQLKSKRGGITVKFKTNKKKQEKKNQLFLLFS
jgi:hypothetical protein